MPRLPKDNIQKTFSIPRPLWLKVEKKLAKLHGKPFALGVLSDHIIQLLERWVDER